jgi:hypothetical protein
VIVGAGSGGVGVLDAGVLDAGVLDAGATLRRLLVIAFAPALQ